jgi:hypothetical protein
MSPSIFISHFIIFKKIKCYVKIKKKEIKQKRRNNDEEEENFFSVLWKKESLTYK